jgi:hypothetical protein
LKIIEEVVEASKNDFEESGVGQGTLNELQQVSNNTPACLLWFPEGRLSAMKRDRRRRSQDNLVDCWGTMGLLLRLAVSPWADRWLKAATPAIAAAAISERRQTKRGAQGSRAPGCALLLHRRLKAISLPHSPTHSVALNHLQLV